MDKQSDAANPNARMPNAEMPRNPKSEARSQRRSDGALAGTIQLRRTLALT